MSQLAQSPVGSEVVPLPANIKSVQPGGGTCYSLELAWGRWRRAWLSTFRRGYVERMARSMRGSTDGAPHAILDPRDLKFCRNLCTAHWLPADDPFQWRERLPFARWGLVELFVLGLPPLALAVGLAFTRWWPLAVAPAVFAALIIYFFRDPRRTVPAESGQIVSPADGKIVEIVRLENDPFIGGPAVRIGIFLSVFNVHINRSPVRARVLKLDYHPGLFLNALKPESATANEAMWIGLESLDGPPRKLVVRQIAGLLARRIVCGLRPGEEVDRGEKFGMIKLGSRTELIVPDVPGLAIATKLGETVQAGQSVLATWPEGPT